LEQLEKNTSTFHKKTLGCLLNFSIIIIILLDKNIISCYNVFEVKGRNIKPLTKNEKIKEKNYD